MKLCKEIPRSCVMENKRMAKGWLKARKNELGDKLSFDIRCVGIMDKRRR
jgi:hypothetical protein